jgi:hypothetical protein
MEPLDIPPPLGGCVTEGSLSSANNKFSPVFPTDDCARNGGGRSFPLQPSSSPTRRRVDIIFFQTETTASMFTITSVTDGNLPGEDDVGLFNLRRFVWRAARVTFPHTSSRRHRPPTPSRKRSWVPQVEGGLHALFVLPQIRKEAC